MNSPYHQFIIQILVDPDSARRKFYVVVMNTSHFTDESSPCRRRKETLVWIVVHSLLFRFVPI